MRQSEPSCSIKGSRFRLATVRARTATATLPFGSRMVTKSVGSLPASKVNASLETVYGWDEPPGDRAVEPAEMFPRAEARTRTQFQFEDVRPIIEGNKIASGRIRISYEARTDNDTNSSRRFDTTTAKASRWTRKRGASSSHAAGRSNPLCGTDSAHGSGWRLRMRANHGKQHKDEALGLH